MMQVAGLMLLAAVSAFGQSFISGTVVDGITGVPLSKTEIRTEGDGKLLTTSDAKGAFTLADVPAGHYVLIGHRNGYLEGRPAAITVEASQSVKDFVYKLTPFGVIAGTVRDQDGEALADVEVSAFRFSYQGGHRLLTVGDSVMTDDLGQYRITGLEPGRYFVLARPSHLEAFRYDQPSSAAGKKREVMVPALYPGVPDPASASQVTVDAGARVTGIDIVTPRRTVVRVTGHLTAPPGTTQPYVSLNPVGSESDDNMNLGLQANMGKNGDFVFPAVPSGSYVVKAAAQLPAKPTTEIFELINNRLEGRVPLHVGDSPVQGVQIAIMPGTEVVGQIRTEGEPGAKFTGNKIEFNAGRRETIIPTVQQDQTFRTTLTPGHYFAEPWFSGNQNYYLRSVLADGRDVTDEGLEVTGPGKVSLEVVVSGDGGQMEGVVSDKDGVAIPGATVVLIPEPRKRVRVDLFIHNETDQNGVYRMKGIPPGSYKLFAWKDLEDGTWFDPDFLRNYEARGEAVAVEAGGKMSKSLTVLP
jgi:hypothetical protein